MGQKDAELTASKVQDLGGGLTALRGRVEAALPQLLHAVQELAAQLRGNGQIAEQDAKGEQDIADSLRAVHDVCNREYNGSPLFASRQEHEALQKLQKAM